MCQHENCIGTYGEAYAKSTSVVIVVSVYCDKCKGVLTGKSFVHAGGELYTHLLKCPHCGWEARVTVKPMAIVLPR